VSELLLPLQSFKKSIPDAEFSTTSYPANDNIRDTKLAYDWLPSLLRMLLDDLVCPEVKKVKSPVVFGVSVSMDHAFASKWLVQLLYRSVCFVRRGSSLQAVCNSV
jgi:hypothetical protein